MCRILFRQLAGRERDGYAAEAAGLPDLMVSIATALPCCTAAHTGKLWSDATDLPSYVPNPGNAGFSPCPQTEGMGACVKCRECDEFAS